MVIKINYKYVLTFVCIVVVLTLLTGNILAPSVKIADNKMENEDYEVKLPVAMYHHILNSPSMLGDYVISPQQFEDDLKYIQSKGYTTITSNELLDFLENEKPLPEKPIMITFDDGFESVYEYAYPLLKKYDMKAIVSVIGKHTDLFSDEKQPKHINYSHLSWNQLRELQKSGVFEIQNHTYDMHEPPNSRRFGIKINKSESKEEYREALINDIGKFNEQITKEIGVAPTVFALPFGIQCKECTDILNEMGFKLILTCEEKVNKISPQSKLPLKLKRFNRASKYSTHKYYSKLLKE